MTSELARSSSPSLHEAISQTRSSFFFFLIFFLTFHINHMEQDPITIAICFVFSTETMMWRSFGSDPLPHPAPLLPSGRLFFPILIGTVEPEAISLPRVYACVRVYVRLVMVHCSCHVRNLRGDGTVRCVASLISFFLVFLPVAEESNSPGVTMRMCMDLEQI
jgi:hypothetical protein